MDKKDRESLEIIEDLRPYKHTIEKILEQRIKELEWNSFRYFKGTQGSLICKEQYEKVIKAKKIKNLLSTLFYEGKK